MVHIPKQSELDDMQRLDPDNPIMWTWVDRDFGVVKSTENIIEGQHEPTQAELDDLFRN